MELNLKLASFARRLWLLEFIDQLAAGLLAAIGVSTLVVGIDRLLYLGTDARLVAGVTLLAALAWAVISVVLWKPVTQLDAAIRADRALGLGDRIPSAVQLRDQGGAWALAVADDAAQRLKAASPVAVFPYTATWPPRLVVPAAIAFILVALAPSVDLLGRMRREVRLRVAAETEATSTANALAAASRRLPPHSAVAADSLGGLRVSLVRIEKELLKGLDDSQRTELAADLRRLAALLGEEHGGKQLAERIKAAADAIAKGAKDATEMLRGAQEELARLEEMLRSTVALSPEMQKLAEAERASFRAAAATAATSNVKADTNPADADLVDVAALGKEGGGRADPTGIIYPLDEPRAPLLGAEARYEQALSSALVDLETGRIPAGYARLIRAYFDAIRPIGP